MAMLFGGIPLVFKLSFTIVASEADAKQAPYWVGCGIIVDSGRKRGDRVYCCALDMMASDSTPLRILLMYITDQKLRYSEWRG
ncbi:hypothetical protein BDP81DRAFT_434090 [Colletotrichum phormii]|uniref:Secreted protein n=1 Tax=Colletotrichum phormii TaxID=359342 RepID=A0AAI9ZKC7_9PEZI|nr:uncharacterized protein BDP81DRAFT_434090 [Colletotrichum phormii]KAK1633586.1 hypothetical protein BDP81DRAFT_434090 [Colletotrichum phormii]